MSGSVIQPWRVLKGNGAQPRTLRLLENAGETFLQGTPVVVTSGYLATSPTLSSALTIAGFAQQKAANLTTDGVPKVQNQGAPINQPNAVIIPGGEWPNDGRCGVWVADDGVTFRGNLKSDQIWSMTTSRASLAGLTKDGTSLLWYVDLSITAAASGAIVELIDSIESQFGQTLSLGGPVEFKITKAAQQFVL